MSYLPTVFKLLSAINYSDNFGNVSYDTIQEYLEASEVPLSGDDLTQFIDTMENILKYLVQMQGQSDEDLEQQLASSFEVPNKNIKEIMSFWTKDKHVVFDMIQRKGSQTGELQDLKWSLNLKTYGKNAKNMREPTVVMNLKAQNNTGPKNIVFEMNKEQLDEFYDDLEQIEESLNHLLAPQE